MMMLNESYKSTDPENHVADESSPQQSPLKQSPLKQSPLTSLHSPKSHYPNPGTVLERCDDTQHVIELVHAGTLFSDPALEQGEVSEAIRSYFQKTAESGITTVYLVGLYEPGDFSKLVMPYFAQEWSKVPPPHHIGPSVFSVLDYTPREALSSWTNVNKVIETAAEEGVTLVFDFIPNTIAVDSIISMKNPHFIRDFQHADRSIDDLKTAISTLEQAGQKLYERHSNHALAGKAATHSLHVYQDGPDTEIMAFTRDFGDEQFSVYLQRSYQSGFKPYGYIVHAQADGHEVVHCKQLGTDGFINWADVFMLETNAAEVKQWQSDVIAHLSSLVPALRADMAHLPNPDYWTDVQKLIEDQQEPLAEIWGEAYGGHAHQALADRNIHSYANYLREWLTETPMNVSALMHQLYQDASGADFYKRGMSIAYTANHDDAMGTKLPKEAAALAILTALPVTKVMIAQGQRHGDTHRYGADQHVPLDEFYDAIARARRDDPGYAAFMDRLLPLMGAKVFRSPDSSFHPVQISKLEHRNPKQLFHIVRQLENEKVLTLVQAETAHKDSVVEIDIHASFGITATDAKDYQLLDLISGEVQDVPKTLGIKSNVQLPGFDVTFLTLIPRTSDI